MGDCCSSQGGRKSEADAARQLESLFILDSEDFLRTGSLEDFDKYYDVLEQDTQSHINCVTCLVTEKETGTTKFCKIVLKKEDMPMKRVIKTCSWMGRI